MWFNGAEFTNPPGSQVLVQTTPLTQNEFDVVVAIQNSVQAMAFLEQRDVADLVTLKSYRLRLATGEYVRDFKAVNIITGESLRVRLDAAIVGIIEADIFVVIRAPVP